MTSDKNYHSSVLKKFLTNYQTCVIIQTDKRKGNKPMKTYICDYAKTSPAVVSLVVNDTFARERITTAYRELDEDTFEFHVWDLPHALWSELDAIMAPYLVDE